MMSFEALFVLSLVTPIPGIRQAYDDDGKVAILTWQKTP